MIIASISITPLNLPLNEPFSIATGHQAEIKNVILQIQLSSGVSGLGEAAPFPAVSGETQDSAIAALEQIRTLILGRDIRQWRLIAEDVAKLIPAQHAAQCALHMAMIDALTKSGGLSVSAFFGGASQLLRTDMTIIAGTVEHAATSAKDIMQRGINTIKIKTAGKDIALDFARIQKVHKVAPTASILLDGNCGYTYDGAMELTKHLRMAGIPIVFFEQPFPRDDWDVMAEFAHNSGVRIAADESARTAEDVLRIIREESAQVINIKLMKSGLPEALRMVEIARAAGLELMIGGMVETILAMTFSAHFAAGLGGFQYADLDTPLFIPEHPFKGGFTLNGEEIHVDLTISGHGVVL